MSDRSDYSGMINEILLKIERIGELSEDERAYAFRTYRLLHEIRSFRLMPIFLGLLFAGTLCFVTSIVFWKTLGANDLNLTGIILGSFFVYYIACFSFLKLKYYNPWIKAAISGFKFVMEKDAKIKSVIELVKAKDPEMAKPINKYLLS